MKTFINHLIPRIQQYSRKLDDLTLLTNQHWVVVDEIANSKTVYIFRNNNELLISSDGEVEKGKWEYLGNNSILIDKQDKSYLFKHGFFDENVLALKVDGRDEYAFMVNENNYNGELNTIENVTHFLDNKYSVSVPKPFLSTPNIENNTVREGTLSEQEDSENYHIIVFLLIFFAFFLILYLISN
jgi:hypothetical protein